MNLIYALELSCFNIKSWKITKEWIFGLNSTENLIITYYAGLKCLHFTLESL